MYSLVSVCKVCTRRVLDEQLKLGPDLDKCIYCLVGQLTEELTKLQQHRDDLMFSFELLEHSYNQVHEVYEAAILDNQQKYSELEILKASLLKYKK
jgi:hypothetical protein